MLFYWGLLKILLITGRGRVFLKNENVCDSEGDHFSYQALAHVQPQLLAEARGKWPALLQIALRATGA